MVLNPDILILFQENFINSHESIRIDSWNLIPLVSIYINRKTPGVKTPGVLWLMCLMEGGMNVGEQANHRHDTLSRKLETERAYKSGTGEQKSQPKRPENVRKGLQIRHRRAEESA